VRLASNPAEGPLTDIRLLAPERQPRRTTATITRANGNNAFVHEGVRLGPLDSIRALDAATAKVELWPKIHDKRNTVIFGRRGVWRVLPVAACRD